ncbi:MAG: hypothetical protein FWH22_09840 [Fibromonadales bacterium]|nr:hypothetical protein [Fibromonadales bacterium]
MTRTAEQIVGTATAPNYEWAYTFYECQNLTMGEGFTFSESWNSITTVGDFFAGSMFYRVSGSEFMVNDVFKFPALSQTELDKGGVFAGTFYNSPAISGAEQTRTAASIINNTLVPTANSQHA